MRKQRQNTTSFYNPFGSSMTSYKNPEFSYVYGFGGHEKVDEISGSGNHYTAEYWEMDPRLARRWNPDPVVKFHESPYAILANNPIWFVDPNGADTLDIMKNDAGKWIVSNTQIVEGDDVFRVKVGDETNSYTFSEGEYGKRVNVLNLENNDNYTLSIYHISGAEEGGTGYAVTPGGSASGEVNSNKRLPTDVYDLEASPNSGVIWRQPWVVRGENTGSVRSRGVKFHFGYTEPRKWTKGCFVISSDYDIQYGVIKYTQEQSRQAVRDFDRHLGATEVYNYKDKKKYTQIGAKFKKTKLDHKLILKDAF